MGLAATVSEALGEAPNTTYAFRTANGIERGTASSPEVAIKYGQAVGIPVRQEEAGRPSPFSGLADIVASALEAEAPKTAPKVAAPKPEEKPYGRFDLKKAPVADTIGTLATGAGSMILGGLKGLYELATGGGAAKAANAVETTQAAGTSVPKSEGGKVVIEAVASPWNPLNWPMVAAKKGSELLSESKAGSGQLAQVMAPVAAGLEAGAAMLAPGAALKAAKTPVRAAEAAGKAEFGSVGASSASRGAALEADLAGATPELQQAVKKLKLVDINKEALARQIEADSLPIPVKLTAGQASQDVQLLSREQNNRGRDKALSDRFSQQGTQLTENINAIREKAAPDVFGTNHVENGRALIDAYKATDDALNADIKAKYKALEDANGGQFPVDGKTFVANAEAALGKKLKTEFLPPAIAKQMEKFKNGEPMNFEQFEALRTNLASEMRKAERAGDGNAEIAASIVRGALEDLPLGGAQSFTTMSGGAASIKPLADAARAAAKARFDLLKKDPAYKAAVNDTVAPDDFISKFVVRGKADDIKTMVEHLGRDSVAHQTMSAGAINYLKGKAGIVNEAGNFSQAGYNRALQELSPKLLDIVGPVTKRELETLGNVARYTQAQPRGSFVNNSNTLVGAMAEGAKGFAEGAANKVVGLGVVPVGSMVRESAARRAAAKESMKSLQTGAGISLKDIGKK